MTKKRDRRAYMAEYNAKPENKRRAAEYSANPEVKRRAAEYRAKPENKRRKARYNAEYNAAYYADPKNKQRQSELQRFLKYDLTPTEYNFMLAGQGFLCALCGADDPGVKNWQTDHCHATGRVRGILCVGCNTGLGKLGDTPESLERAFLYTKGELSWTNSTKPTSAMAGPSKHSPHIAQNESRHTNWSAGLL